MKNKLISIIIPLYNEAERLHNLTSIYSYFERKKFVFEIILVNDGSTDQTKLEIKKIMKLKESIKLISYPKNRGKGFAIKQGMLSATGQYLIFTDIDLSTPIDEFENFIPYLKKYDLLVGSRKMRGSKVVIRQPWIRELLGKGFTKLSQIILQVKVSDFTCGFKCFSKKASKEIFTAQKVEGWSFDSEILFLAKKFGYKIKEIPVKWVDDRGSKVKFPHDILTSLKDLYTIRINEIKGIYG